MSIVRIELSEKTFALIDTRGATLRRLVIDGTDLIQGVDITQPNQLGAGDVLIPWPNRIRDGKWMLGSTEQQLEITEPDRNNAIHGLVRRKEHDIAEQVLTRVKLTTQVKNEPGYPYQLVVSTSYSMVDEGIVVTHDVLNATEQSAPIAIGVHPYIRIGNIPVEDLTLHVSAKTRILVDERLNPVGTASVEGTEFDLRNGRRVGDCELDTAFTDITTVDGIYSHELVASDSSRVSVWAGELFDHVQVYTTSNFPGPSGPVTAIAVEPMTSPPNGLNALEHMKYVSPNETLSARWGIVFSPAQGV